MRQYKFNNAECIPATMGLLCGGFMALSIPGSNYSSEMRLLAVVITLLVLGFFLILFFACAHAAARRHNTREQTQRNEFNVVAVTDKSITLQGLTHQHTFELERLPGQPVCIPVVRTNQGDCTEVTPALLAQTDAIFAQSRVQPKGSES